ncbi:hypothetical protein QQS21_005139 [Conoideocrella luteorostrata]|uniref:Uncharacterized protein n=1 Tax=Conoideocrella luteorostrata TaxID=1105319 RepID=A0AAJ0CR18_9HYPO|nr:hypothetical protein QQS21_005139 [Conoideocrella luteorostrata]
MRLSKSMGTLNVLTPDAGSAIRVVETALPTVGTDWHRNRINPDNNKNENNSKSLDIVEFTDEISKKLESGDEIISARPVNSIVNKWHSAHGDQYRQAASGT